MVQENQAVLTGLVQQAQASQASASSPTSSGTSLAAKDLSKVLKHPINFGQGVRLGMMNLQNGLPGLGSSSST